MDSISKISWVVIFCALTIYVHAQFQRCPKFKWHEWKSEKEFMDAQDSVRNLCRWLNETPIGWEYENRTSANLYVISWLTSHPSKKWEWNTSCFGPLEDHLDMMYAFIHASLYYSLTHENASDLQREVFVLVSMSKKIEQSNRYDKMEEWQPIVKAVRKGREMEYLENCRGVNQPKLSRVK